MQKIQHTTLRKSALASAIVVAIGAGTTTTTNADVYVWGSTLPDLTNYTDISPGPPPFLTSPLYANICSDSVTDPTKEPATIIFTMLDNFGGTLANSSITGKQVNQHQTPTCGTLTYDTDPDDNPTSADGTGTITIAPFDFFNGTLPAVARDIVLNEVPTGLDDTSGTMILANMIFDWDGNNGIPVSISYQAAPLLNEMDGTPVSFTLNADGSINTAIDLVGDMTGSGGILGEVPASDGTYVGLFPGGGLPTDAGYLALGPVPLATTEFNTTNVPGCVAVPGGCTEVNPSADITASSAVPDTDPNTKEYLRGDGVGIGGNPMQDGPFQFKNANFDFTNMRLVSFTDNTAPVITESGIQGLVINKSAGESYVEDGATCTDAAPLNTNLDGSVVIGGDVIPDPLTVAGSPFTVTYDCQDPSTNDAVQVSRTINVAAAGVPIITLTGAASVTHECEALPSTYVDLGATCNDPGVGGDGPIVAPFTPPQDLSLSTLGLDVTTPGPQSVTWSCTDLDSNTATQDRTVVVEDKTDPDVALLGTDPDVVVSSTISNPATYTDPGASVDDLCDTTLPAIITASTGIVDMDVPDTGPAVVSTVLGYSVTDASGNITNLSRTVNVVRSQPSVKPLVAKPIELNGTYIEPGFDVFDEQDGNATGIKAVSSACLGGTSVCTIDASAINTNVGGVYPVVYTVTDRDGNTTTATSQVVVDPFATGSNFTMLDKAGTSFGGTNDVFFAWNGSDPDTIPFTPGTSYTTIDAASGVANIFIGSINSEPFSGSVWDAHDIRVFGPGTYSFDSGCTVAELQATGCPAGSAAISGPDVTMTVPAGMYGAHMLFDWNNNLNIDVVNLWDASEIVPWSDPDGDTSRLNDLFTGTHYDENGQIPAKNTLWSLVSTDLDGDGFNGSKMVDGPFEGFYANFSAGPKTKEDPPAPPKMTAKDTKLDDATLGSLSWGMLLGLSSLMGLLRRRNKK